MSFPALLVRCPSCRSGTLAPDGPAKAVCGHCGGAFPVGDGFLDLLPPPETRPSFAQRAMEWPPLIGIYESRFWRRSPLFGLGFGIDFDGEQALVLRSLALRPGARVLDLACGPGIYTRPIARAIAPGTVIGLDLSGPMLRYATARAQRESIDNIVWVRASAFDLPLPDGAVDGVCCCAALHLFPDLPAALAEIFRVLKPGGRFAFGMARRLDGALGEIEDLTTAWSGLRARGRDDLLALFDRVGFRDARIDHARRIWQIGSAVRPD